MVYRLGQIISITKYIVIRILKVDIISIMNLALQSLWKYTSYHSYSTSHALPIITIHAAVDVDFIKLVIPVGIRINLFINCKLTHNGDIRMRILTLN